MLTLGQREPRKGRGQAEVIAVTTIDTPNKRIDESIIRLPAEPALDNEQAPSPWRHSAEGRVPTAYELEWRAEGRDMHYFAYRKRPETGVGRLGT